MENERMADAAYTGTMHKVASMEVEEIIAHLAEVLGDLSNLYIECNARGLEKAMGHRSARSVQSSKFIGTVRAVNAKLENKGLRVHLDYKGSQYTVEIKVEK